ncbi:MAG TPA: hypothetical protein VN688_16675 [Gemmataceae bacterium]|nr:hypothetical protein [Gemmataceae bacterium]
MKMIPGAETFPFLPTNPATGPLALMPLLPLRLELPPQSISVLGLLDTASAVNVLPLDIGLQLGAVWDDQKMSVQLTGNLASVPACGLVVSAIVGRFLPVRLAFAWAQTNHVPLILGQLNFFAEFDAYFSRSTALFEVKPK